ncbi:MAG: DNA primase [Selenomonadaceae bacterium]|nr:DNA primase [Selenomonadaceae bacterium]
MHSEAMDAFVAQVDAQTDILQVVQSYVPMKRRGNRYWGCCPFHHEKTPSFSVVPDKGFFYCFGCHAGGNAFKFLSLIENITYFDAIRMQAEKLGIPMPARERTPEQEARDRQFANLRQVNKMARDYFHNCLTLTRYGQPGLAYFAGRGISKETIEEFSLGFAPDAWDMLSRAFQKREVPAEVLLAAGLSAQRRQGNGLYDRFRNRVIIPIADIRGRVVGFGGRVLDDSKPKYLNTPETILFNKRKLLFGLDRSHRAIQDVGYAIVVEGYMDAISVFGAGVQNVVATLGTAFTQEHARLLLQYAQRIYFCYDSDAAGQKATLRALSIVQRTGAEVRVIVVPDGKDPDEYIRKHGAEAFRKLAEKAQDLYSYMLQHALREFDAGTPDGRSRITQAMAPVIADAANTMQRQDYEKRLAQALLVDEGTLKDNLKRAVREAPPEETMPAVAPVRQAVHRADSAEQKAGRCIIRRVWQQPELLEGLADDLPDEAIADTVQKEILSYLRQQAAAGKPFDAARAAAELSGEAGDDLTLALTEDTDPDHPEHEVRAYEDSVTLLRRRYLERLRAAHSRAAQAASEAGDAAKAMQELAEVRTLMQLIEATQEA